MRAIVRVVHDVAAPAVDADRELTNYLYKTHGRY